MHIVLDCANGAAYKTAPAVFRELGARVTVIANEPNGLNINQDCGSTHPEHLQTTVMLHKADVGIALDGDADRCLMIDPRGQLIDGDQILYLIAMHRHRTGSLKGPVVGTLMSNLGLEQALKREGLAFVRANVGDRYVMELLQQHGGVVGGEGSGHTLCLDKSIAGDGTVTALQVLAALIESRQTLHEAVSGMVKFPQVLLNLKGLDKALLKHEAVLAEAAAVETTLGSRGRLLLRASGTEALIRVMVEADDLPFAQVQAERMAAVLQALQGLG
jgi:phosphoglucosamine mutase